MTIDNKRREILKLSAKASFGLAAMPLLTNPLLTPVASAAELPQNKRLHGISLYGDVKYPADFKYLDYVNPEAPKGGRISTSARFWNYNQNPRTFNTLNGYTLKGDGPIRLEFTFDTLMRQVYDEMDSFYGLLASEIEINDQGNTWHFYLRPEARFHDGTPLTGYDVEFSLQTLKSKGHPDLKQSLKYITKIAGEKQKVSIYLDGQQAVPDIFRIMSSCPIFSQAAFKDRDFAATTMEPIMSSGPYRIGRFSQGKYLEYDRVPDYWGRDLPINKGRYNFDTIRYEYYADDDVAFVAFTKGKLNFREELSSKTWATKYDFPAVKSGKVVKFTPPSISPGDVYGWFFNLRRDKFKNPLVRQALGLAFNFEWTNKNLFYKQYKRQTSLFLGNDYMAEGKPAREELALMEPFKDQLPASVFGEAILPPVSDVRGNDRKNLAKARDLLIKAGYKQQGNSLVDANGKQLEIEFLSYSPGYQRIVLPYIDNLEKIGIKATFRLVDSAQYQLRLKSFDFDMTSARWSYSNFPTAADIKDLFGSQAAKLPGSYNLSGISHPAIDAMIKALGEAETREDAKVILRAFDRILRSLDVYIPCWTSSTYRIAMWDIFGIPEKLPSYRDEFMETLWYDETKAEKHGL